MKIININNRKKKKGKERRKRITDLFALVCELEWVEIEVLWLRKAVAARRHEATATTRSVTTVTVMHLDSAWRARVTTMPKSNSVAAYSAGFNS